LDVYVNSSIGASISQANVTSWMSNGTQVFTELTDGTGYIDRQILTEYTHNRSQIYPKNVTYFTNYIVNTTKSGFTENTTEVNLTESKMIYLTLTDIEYPQYYNDSVNNTYAGQPTEFSLYWTDNVGLSGYIFSTNNTGTWKNDSWVSFNWWNTSWKRRIRLNISESMGHARINEPIDKWIDFDTNPINATKEIRVTQCPKENTTCSGAEEIEIKSQVYNKTIVSGVDDSANIVFLANSSAYSWRIYYIYYNYSQAEYPNYSDEVIINNVTTGIAGDINITTDDYYTELSGDDLGGTRREGLLSLVIDGVDYPHPLGRMAGPQWFDPQLGSSYNWVNNAQNNKDSNLTLLSVGPIMVVAKTVDGNTTYNDTLTYWFYKDRMKISRGMDANVDTIRIDLYMPADMGTPATSGNDYAYENELSIYPISTEGWSTTVYVSEGTSDDITIPTPYLESQDSDQEPNPIFGLLGFDSTRMNEFNASAHSPLSLTLNSEESYPSSVNQSWSNVTKTLNSTVGTVVGWRFYANDTSGNINASEIFTLTTTGLYPKWSDNTSSIPTTYSPKTLSIFNITWTDADEVFIEMNYSGVNNYSMTNIGGNVYSYNVTLPAGTYYWKSYANSSTDTWNYTDTWYFTVDKAKPVLIMSNDTASVNTSGLVGYWKFDEGIGTAVKDSSGYENNGTLKNDTGSCGVEACPSWTSGRFGQALEFDSKGDYVEVTHSETLNFEGSFTILAWVKSDFLSGYRAIVVKRGSLTQAIYGLWTDGSDLYTEVKNTDRSSEAVGSAGVTLSTDTWYLVGLSRNNSNDILIWLNGVPYNIGTVTGNVDPPHNLFIGVHNTSLGFDQHFDGIIDEVQTWNRSLSSDEIKELYESRVTYGTQTNFTLTESNTGDSDVYYEFFRNGTVAAIYHFDEGSGNYTFDDSGNVNAGTLKNGSKTCNGGDCPSWVDGKYGNALKFDGVNDYVNVPNSDSLNAITDAITIAAWFKLDQLPSEKGEQEDIVHRPLQEYPWTSYMLYVQNDTLTTNRVSCMLSNSTNGTRFTGQFGVDINKNQWYFAACIYNGTHIRVYVNDQGTSGVFFTGPIHSSSLSLRVGAQAPNGNRINGTIDEVYVYPRALSAEEILCHYGNNCSLYGYLNETATLGAGYHYYVARASEGQNYTTSSLLLPLNISKANASATLTLTPPSPITYDTQTTATCTCTQASCTLWRNDTDITSTENGTTITLPAGTWYYVCNASDTENYTDTSDSDYYTVNKAKPVLIMSNDTAEVNTSGLVGYWKFDEGVDTSVRDSSGYSNNGTISGADGDEWVEGKFGSALDFDGSNDYVNAGNDSVFNIINNLTVEAWVYVKNCSEQSIVEKYDTGGKKSYILHIHPDNFRFGICYSSDDNNFTIVTSTITCDSRLNKWTHVIGVFNTSHLLLYINGELNGTLSSSYGVINLATAPLQIGGEYGNWYFNGTIDEVRIWNRSLSAYEIKELYESKVTYGTQTNFSLSESNTGDSDVYYDFFRNGTVAGIWHFDEGSGNYTFDDSGNNNTGTLQNSTHGVPQWTTDCKYGSCLKFDGEGDYTSVPGNSSSLQFGNELTVELWFKMNNKTGVDQRLIDKYWKRPFSLTWDVSESSFDFGMRNSTSDQVESSYTFDPTLGEWYHIAGTYNGSHIQLYFNGTLRDTDYLGGNLENTELDLTIGAGVLGDSPFNGTIDEVRIYPRALSAEEILCHYGNNCSEAGFLNETATLLYGYHYYVARASEGQNYTTSALLLPLNVTWADIESPQYFDNSTSNTNAGKPTTFSLRWTDDYGLSGYIFSLDNCTGTLSNITEGSLSGNEDWSNVTRVINTTVGCTIRWQVYANDTSKNWNTSDIYIFTTTHGPPTYYDNKSSPTSPVQYLPGKFYQFNLTWDDVEGVSTVLIENDFNGTLHNDTVTTYRTISGNRKEYYFNVTDLPAGTYHWREYANNTDDIWNYTPQWTYEVTKNVTSMQLYLNGTDGNYDVYRNQTVNITADLNLSFYVEIWTNFTGTYELWVSGSDPLINYTSMDFGLGPFNVTANYSGNQNYTAAYDSHILTVWGWANLSWVSPDDGSYFVNTTIVLTCRVLDVNLSSPIASYPVDFYNVSETTTSFLGTNTTNSSGHAVFYWNTTGLSPGNYYPKCNITNSSSLYYNVTDDNEANTTINLYSNNPPNIWNLVIRDFNTSEPITQTSTGVTINITVNVTDPDYNLAYVEANFTWPDGTIVYKNLTSVTGKNYTHVWNYTLPWDIPNGTATINVTAYDVYGQANSTNTTLIILETISLTLTNKPVDFSIVYPGQIVNATPGYGWPLNVGVDGNVLVNLTQNASAYLTGLDDPTDKIGIGNVTWNTSDSGTFTPLKTTYSIVNESVQSGQIIPIYYRLFVPLVKPQPYGGYLYIRGEQS